MIYAINHYDNPQCQCIEEFEEDVRRFLYLKKLIVSYKQSKELRERLILNHIIVLYNVYGEFTTNMLFFKIDKDCWDILVTFLIFLQKLPENIPQYGIKVSDISLDKNIIEVLRRI